MLIANVGNRSRRKWPVLILAAISVLVLLIVLTPKPIEGCYTFRDVVTAGHNFMHFSDGKVTYIREYATNRNFGTYSYVAGEGWIWMDSGTGRRILVRPGIFSIRFDAADGIDRVPKYPIELRDWSFRKNAELIKRAATTTITKPQ